MKNPCDKHPEREAVRFIGQHALDGGGTSYFKARLKLCDECYAEWKRHNVAFEWVD